MSAFVLRTDVNKCRHNWILCGAVGLALLVLSSTKPVKVSGHMKINAVSTHSSLALELSKGNLEEKLDQEPAVCQ